MIALKNALTSLHLQWYFLRCHPVALETWIQDIKNNDDFTFAVNQEVEALEATKSAMEALMPHTKAAAV